MKAVVIIHWTHNPSEESHWVSRLRENLTSGSDGEVRREAHRVKCNGKDTLAKSNQQPGTESCAVCGLVICYV